ncbi:MAG: DNA/RNA non-specific endonuclease [Turicibacter sp.]|nr:DNA/RNA non-specific endonuclease [Turicibacter sp.]
MSNRNSNSTQRRPSSNGSGAKKLLLLGGMARAKGRNNRGSNNQKANFRLGKFLLLMLVVVAFIFLARNDFDLGRTLDDIRSFQIFDLFEQDGRADILFADEFYDRAEYLALLYPEGREVVYLEVMTIQADDWEYERLDIGGHDELGRTLPIIAFLSEDNLGISEGRSAQTHTPTGWQQNQFEIDESNVWVKNRGHLIAYTFTFNFNAYGEFVYGYAGSENDPANLFTQTAHSNQNVMTRYEGQIRSILADGGEVVFKAAPIFRDDELMARGIWLQAVSLCEDLMFSVFIFNEQPGVIIDHQTGENWIYE